MTKEEYDKIATVIPLAGLVDERVAALRVALQDAQNQAENGSELGMANAVGRAVNIADDLYSLWESVKG